MTRVLLLMTLLAGASFAQQVTFPTTKAQNLEKKMLSLPGDFKGEYNLLFLAFDLDQHDDVKTWLKVMPDFQRLLPGLEYYEIPAMPKAYKLMKFAIHSGMRYEVPREDQRARTITLFTDLPAFEKTLQIQNEGRIQVLLLDRKGTVIWREEGVYYDIKGDTLKSELSKLRAGSH